MKLRHAVFSVIVLSAVFSAVGMGCSPSAPSVPPTEPAPTATSAPAPEAATGASDGLRTFVIAADQSSASYVVDEEFLADMLPKYGINAGRQNTIGVTKAIEGQIELNLDDLADALGNNYFQADLSKLESDQALRDRWLRENGPQFNQYPEARFVATAIEGAPSTYTDGQEVTFRLVGDLTIREITQPAVFDVTATLDGSTLTGRAEAFVRMTDFGIDPPNFANTLTVQDEFTIQVDFVALEQ